MKKILNNVFIGISIITLSTLIVFATDTFFTICILFDGNVVLCNNFQKEYIHKYTSNKDEFYIIYYTSTFRNEDAEVKIIKKNGIIPNIYGEKITVEKNNLDEEGPLKTFIEKNKNYAYATMICLLPNIMLQIITILVVIRLIKYKK